MTSSSLGGVRCATAPRTAPAARASQAVLQQRLSPARLPLAPRPPGPHRRPARSPRSRRARAVRTLACAAHRAAISSAELSDRRRRQPTVCGAFARPARLLPQSHPPSVRHRQRRRLSNLHRADRTTRSTRSPRPPSSPPPSPRPATSASTISDAWIQRLDPTHPIRRHPERYGQLTKPWCDRPASRHIGPTTHHADVSDEPHVAMGRPPRR